MTGLGFVDQLAESKGCRDENIPLQQHRAESLVSRQNLALGCSKSSTVIYTAQLSRAAVVILRAK